jgi:hypothetical protein
VSAEEVPSEVRAFLSQEVRSLLALELLLLLRTDLARQWTVATLSRELRATNEWTDQELARLVGRGLVQSTPSPDGSAIYNITSGPASFPQIAEFAFGWLAASYPARRFSIIQALYAPKPATQPEKPDPLHQFADAFKIRKERPNG